MVAPSAVPVVSSTAFAVGQFRDSLARLSTSRRLVIDLSGVPFVDSAGLGALVGGIRRVREHGGDVALACNRTTLVRLLNMTGVDRIVTVAPGVDEAVTALGSEEPSPRPPTPQLGYQTS